MSSSHSVQLSSWAKDFIQSEIDNGRSESPEQVIDKAVEMLQRKRAFEEVRRKLNDLIDAGIRSARTGKLLTADEVFEDIVGRKRVGDQRAVS